MSLSNATVTPVNLELTPMRVTYNGVDLGGTLSNVLVTVKYHKSPLKADQFGDTILDSRVSGQEMMVTTELAEVSLKDNWKVAFPNAHLITSGGNKQMYFDMQIGDSDLGLAKVLILHPLSRSNSDLAGDFKFYLATATGESEVTYSPTGQTKIKVVFRIYPDTGTVPAKWMVQGDPSIGIVAASAGTPVFSGTGNGTCTSVSVSNSYTKTETITILNVGAATNGGTFSVTGSISGALGIVTITGGAGGTGSFVSNPINFTLTDGTVDFALSSQFTIATIASNYS